MSADLQHPRCRICGRQDRCREDNPPDQQYPECHRPLLGTRLDKVRELFEWMAGAQGASDPRLDELAAVLLDRFEGDRGHYSEIFEPSFSIDSAGAHLYRFSYAFPGFRADPQGTVGSIAALCAPFGEEVTGHARQLLAPAEDACVEQLLFGLAYDDSENWRVKLYYQFKNHAGDRPLVLAGRLAGATIGDRVASKSLHLLGIDLGRGGIRQVKFYFLHENVPPEVREVGLIKRLASAGRGRLSDFLTIHRMRQKDDPGLESAAEVDFPLIGNELLLDDLLGYSELARLVPAGGPLGQLKSGFRPAFRRISVPVGVLDKVNLYYILTEMDAA
jgi:hypothetical protein